ncbi:MAG: Rap1a/Tai family immunity protein [Hyphomicrobiales bacterium]
MQIIIHRLANIMGAIGVIIIFGWPLSASAQTTSGNDVYEACTATDDARTGFCYGYTIGVWEGIKIGAAVIVRQSDAVESTEMDGFVNTLLGVCVPPEVNNQQIIDIYTQHLAKHPATRHNSARLGIIAALKDVFPCQ